MGPAAFERRDLAEAGSFDVAVRGGSSDLRATAPELGLLKTPILLPDSAQAGLACGDWAWSKMNPQILDGHIAALRASWCTFTWILDIAAVFILGWDNFEDFLDSSRFGIALFAFGCKEYHSGNDV